MSTPSSCTIRNISANKYCANCNSTHYCTKEHQKADWPIHKLICRQYSVMPLRPNPDHKLGIYFPTDHLKPELVWIEMTICPYTGLSIPVIPQLLREDEIENCHTMHDNRRITHNPIRGFNLLGEIRITFRDGFKIDGSLPNKCMYSLIKGPPKEGWYGPVVAMGITGEYEIHDMKISDLRHISDWLTNGWGRQPVTIERGFEDDLFSSIIRT